MRPTPLRAFTPRSSSSRTSPTPPGEAVTRLPHTTSPAQRRDFARIYALVSKVAADVTAAARHGDKLIAGLSPMYAWGRSRPGFVSRGRLDHLQRDEPRAVPSRFLRIGLQADSWTNDAASHLRGTSLGTIQCSRAIRHPRS
jgi:hypothetical protein